MYCGAPPISRRDLLFSALAPPGQQWNLIVVTADNLGYGDLGCYGNTQILTPNLDRFARRGTRFTNFYTASPTCTASRAGLLTGRHPARFGLNYQLSAEENKRGVGLPHTERLLPQHLKPLGYVTGCFGKWNLGFAPGSRPTERGFDEFFGHRSGNIDYYSHIYNGDLDMYRGVEPARVEGYSVDLFADAAIDFLRRHHSRPFLLYLPFNSPHFPNPKNLGAEQSLEWQAPARYFDRYGYPAGEPDPKKRYRAVVTALDDAFGRVINAVDALKLSDKTLTWFFSDNGAFMLPNRGLEVQTNAPLRGGGITCWEGGIRVAGMACWAGHIPAGTTCKELLSACDILPAALRLAGGRMPTDLLYDGIDPLPALQGEKAAPGRALFFEFRGHQAVRQNNWKLVREKPEHNWQLFDLDSDEGERNNLAQQHPVATARLSALYDRWWKEVKR
jgi:arylsulfatase A-like enzyme